MNHRLSVLAAIVWFALGCGGGGTPIGETVKVAKTKPGAAGKKRSIFKTGGCKAIKTELETSEYDTSGDGVPDVRKYFRRIGSGATARLVLICRESDLNGDGVKDVARYYDDEGRPLREEADQDFDGVVDEITYFEHGEITHREIDTDRDGITDLKIFYENGKPLRAERDLSHRSTAKVWKPDEWEYYEDSRLVRIGTDLNGDGRVDRWDRNEELKEASAERSSAPAGAQPAGSEQPGSQPTGG